MVELQHPTTKHLVTISHANWKAFFFGVIWFFWHRDWGDGIFYWFTMFATVGLADFVWPFFAENRLVDYYRLRGYEVTSRKPRAGWESGWAPIAVGFIGFGIVILLSIVDFIITQASPWRILP